LYRSANQHICILLLTNELKPGSDKLQGYSCELQRVTPTVPSMVLIIIDFNGSHEKTNLFYIFSIKMDLPRVLQSKLKKNNNDYADDHHRVLRIKHFTHWKDCLPSEDGTDRLSRNVGNDLPLQDA